MPRGVSSASQSGPLTRILITLTFVTGIVDAVTFLGLGQVFAAMQTGNVIFLGFGIAGAAGAAVVGPLIAIAAFVAGGGFAALLAKLEIRNGVRGLAYGLGVEVAVLGLATLLALAVTVEAEEASGYAVIALLAFAMGLRNTMTRWIGSPNLATTVLNLTLAALPAGGAFDLASRADLTERGVSFAAIVLGAVVGALLLEVELWLPIALAAVITLVAGLASLRARARWREVA